MKEKKFVLLTLRHPEQEGIVQKRMETSSLLAMSKTAMSLSKLNAQGWELVEVSGNDQPKVEMFRKVMKGYVPTAKEAMSFSGLQNVPGKIQGAVNKVFRKSDEESPGKS